MERQAADATATAIATATTTVTSSSSSSSGKYKYFVAERRPIEVLVIVTAPEHVEEFIALDHEIWTLGEALCNLPPAGNSDEASSLASASASTSAVAVDQSTIPFISKDVWLHDNRPGEITLVFTWESQSHWDGVDDEALQKRLQTEFDARFPHPYTMTRLPKDPLNIGLHRVTRFERE